jgi:hypothetical protein
MSPVGLTFGNPLGALDGALDDDMGGFCIWPEDQHDDCVT